MIHRILSCSPGSWCETFPIFTFFNKLDLLEIRLNVLKGVIDKFVFVEAGDTHTGNPKPFYFKENEARFAAIKD